MTPNFINISQVTSKQLKDKAYLTLFPEYYELATVIENNPWHNHQNVLDHVINVYSGLEKILEFDDLELNQKKLLKKYLSETIGNQTRLNILKVATLLHDIAKTDTLVKRADGMALCPCHDLIGAGRVKHFAKRFNLDNKAELYTERIVRYHGFISEILNFMIVYQDKEKYFRIFNETVDDVAIELTLLMRADILGSDLEKADQKGYSDRISLLEWMLTMSLKEVK